MGRHEGHEPFGWLFTVIHDSWLIEYVPVDCNNANCMIKPTKSDEYLFCTSLYTYLDQRTWGGLTPWWKMSCLKHVKTIPSSYLLLVVWPGAPNEAPAAHVPVPPQGRTNEFPPRCDDVDHVGLLDGGEPVGHDHHGHVMVCHQVVDGHPSPNKH